MSYPPVLSTAKPLAFLKGQMNNIDEQIDSLKSQIKRCVDKIKVLRRHRTILMELPDGAVCGDRIDFDNLEHKDVLKVIKKLGGKWKKSLNSEPGKVDYETTFEGLQVRCWAAKPPPSCRMVEVEEIIPPQPEKRVKRMKLVCVGEGEPVASEVAIANQPIPNGQPINV